MRTKMLLARYTWHTESAANARIQSSALQIVQQRGGRLSGQAMPMHVKLSAAGNCHTLTTIAAADSNKPLQGCTWE